MSKTFIGSARQAGKQIIHTVTLDGEVIGTRRSEREYAYAYVKANRDQRETAYTVVRWSKSPKTSPSETRVPIGETTDASGAVPEKAPNVWVATYVDGETREVIVGRSGPYGAALAARPGIEVTGCRKKAS